MKVALNQLFSTLQTVTKFVFEIKTFRKGVLHGSSLAMVTFYDTIMSASSYATIGVLYCTITLLLSEAVVNRAKPSMLYSFLKALKLVLSLLKFGKMVLTKISVYVTT